MFYLIIIVWMEKGLERSKLGCETTSAFYSTFGYVYISLKPSLLTWEKFKLLSYNSFYFNPLLFHSIYDLTPIFFLLLSRKQIHVSLECDSTQFIG